MRRLNHRQQAFVEHYVRHGNASQAAREAGYAAAGARVRAHRLLTKANVQQAIRCCNQAYKSKIGLRRDQVISELQTAVAIAQDRRNPKAMISAWREIARICGFYDAQMPETSGGSRQKHLVETEPLSDSELIQLIAGQ